MRNKSGHIFCMAGIKLAELGQRLFFFSSSQALIDPDQNGKQGQGRQRGPLNQKSQHDNDKSGVLRVPYPGIGSGAGDFEIAPGPVKHFP